MTQGASPVTVARSLLDLLARRLRGAAEAELAASLGIDPTNVVALLNELESAGLIERRRSPADRRRHTVVLTPAGAERLAEIENALARLEHRLFAAMDSEEQGALYGLLQRAASATGGTPSSPELGCAGAMDESC